MLTPNPPFLLYALKSIIFFKTRFNSNSHHPYMKASILSVTLIFLTVNAFAQQEILSQIRIKNDSISHYNAMIKRLQSGVETLKLKEIRQEITGILLPKTEPGEEVIHHKAMSLVYSEKHEQPKWVAHVISPDIRFGSEGRSNDFRPDSMVRTGTAVESDYFLKTMKPDSTFVYDAFGYDRGHLAPSADFRWSAAALSESYLYSNMSPMLADFNRDSWAKMEDLFRAYMYKNPNTRLYIVTGPVLSEDLSKIPRAVHNVTIPKKYFKVAMDLTNKKAIAFVMPNAKNDAPLETFATSIDDVEALTGIDFFYQLEDGGEQALEAQKDPKPFMSSAEQDDVTPDHPTKLPRNCYNTVMAKGQMGTGREIRVQGTVVSTKLSSKGNVFLNLDKRFPNQIFTVTIFKDQMINFSYPPDKFLEGKKIIVKGVVTNFNGTPSIAVEDEDDIEILEDYQN